MKPQTRTVLALLRLYPHGVTQIEAWQSGAGFRLSGRILELRQVGYDIETTWETFGDARYARYVLHEAPRQITFGLVPDNPSEPRAKISA